MHLCRIYMKYTTQLTLYKIEFVFGQYYTQGFKLSYTIISYDPFSRNVSNYNWTFLNFVKLESPLNMLDTLTKTVNYIMIIFIIKFLDFSRNLLTNQ